MEDQDRLSAAQRDEAASMAMSPDSFAALAQFQADAPAAARAQSHASGLSSQDESKHRASSTSPERLASATPDTAASTPQPDVQTSGSPQENDSQSNVGAPAQENSPPKPAISPLHGENYDMLDVAEDQPMPDASDEATGTANGNDTMTTEHRESLTHEQNIVSIVEMGFPRSDVEAALTSRNFDRDLAMNDLLQQFSAVVEESAIAERERKISGVVEMGFERSLVEAAFLAANDDPKQAMGYIIQGVPKSYQSDQKDAAPLEAGQIPAAFAQDGTKIKAEEIFTPEVISLMDSGDELAVKIKSNSSSPTSRRLVKKESLSPVRRSNLQSGDVVDLTNDSESDGLFVSQVPLPHGPKIRKGQLDKISHFRLPGGRAGMANRPLPENHSPASFSISNVILGDGGIRKKSSRKRSKAAKKLTNVDKIIGYDLFEDDDAGIVHEEAPDIEARNLKDQYEAMLIGCPEDSDKAQNKRDRAAIKKSVTNLNHQKQPGYRQVLASNCRWLQNGMRTTLYHHQIQGVSWMYTREINPGDGPRGGILGDAMGLGKTLQTIGLMVRNPPGKNVPRECRATLIVVPSTILDQWEDELYTHYSLDNLPHVHVFRKSENALRAKVLNHEIVLTSYWEVTQSCPWDEVKVERLRTKNRQEGEDSQYDSTAPVEDLINGFISNGSGGLLHQVEWYRVVLDEAHYVKNHLSQGSFAVNALKAKFRWALSGTIVMNNPEEYYSQLRFLKAAPTQTYKEFKKEYCLPEVHHKLRSLNHTVILRRTINTMLLGRPLVVLPQKHKHELPITATIAEQIIYNRAVEKYQEKRQEEPEKLDKGEKKKRRLNQLVRLRQLTFDPLMIPRELKQLFSAKDLREIHTEMRQNCDPSDYVMREVAKWTEDRRTGGPLNEDTDSDMPESCCLCRDHAADPIYINIRSKEAACGHIFCRLCIEPYAHSKIQENVKMLCPECLCEFDLENLKPYRARQIQNVSVKQSRKFSRNRPKGVDFNGYRPRVDPKADHSAAEWIEAHDDRPSPVPRSSKLRILDVELGKRQPGEKSIIYVQWVQAAIAIGTMLEEAKIKFVYYLGDMSPQRRKAAAATMRVNDGTDVNVMICGLKCGSVGLNWTWANLAVITDPWWNSCVEQQAFSRIYRIGQTKETHLVKLSVTGTVDDRLIALQKKKSAMLEATTPKELTSEEFETLLTMRHKR